MTLTEEYSKQTIPNKLKPIDVVALFKIENDTLLKM